MPNFETYKMWIEDYLDATESARERAGRRRDFYDGIQWTHKEAQDLKDRGQPVLTYNYIQEKVGTLIGAEVNGRTYPVAKGRNVGIDQATAAVATAGMRYVTDEADWDGERSMGREQLVTEGVTGTEVLVDREAIVAAMAAVNGQVMGAEVKRENPEIKIHHVMYDRLFWDPHSRFDDFRDAKYFGTIIWQDLDDAIADWPDKAELLEQCAHFASGTSDEDFDDKPDHWFDGSRNRDRVRIASMWFRDGGEWFLTYLCGSGLLLEPIKSPYVDDRDRTVPGLILQSSSTMRTSNERYGPVQNMMSPQEDINKRHSKATFLLNANLVVADEDAFRDPRKAREELHKPDGLVLKKRGADVQVVDHRAQVIDNLQMLQEAKAAMGQFGPPEGLVGQVSASTSGVALHQRQAAALVKFGKLLNNSQRWETRVYRHIWWRMRQFWTEHDWIRVTEDEDAETYLEVNKPIRVADAMMENGITEQELGMLQQSGQLEMAGIDPNQVLAVQNHLQELDLDIIIESRPGSPTYRQDQMAVLADAIGKLPLPPEAVSAAAEMILEMTDLDPRIKKRLQQRLQPDPQAQQAAAQAQAQQAALEQQLSALQMQKIQSDIAKTQAEVEKLRAEVDTEETAAIENVANANRSMADAAQKQAETGIKIQQVEFPDRGQQGQDIDPTNVGR